MNYVSDQAVSHSTITYLCDKVDGVWEAARARSTAAEVWNKSSQFICKDIAIACIVHCKGMKL